MIIKGFDIFPSDVGTRIKDVIVEPYKPVLLLTTGRRSLAGLPSNVGRKPKPCKLRISTMTLVGGISHLII
jgi:hypothetical protein